MEICHSAMISRFISLVILLPWKIDIKFGSAVARW